MSLKNKVIKFTEWWINLTRTNSEPYKAALQTLLADCNHLPYHAHLLSDLSQITNIKKFPQEAEAVYSVIQSFCASKVSKKRFDDLTELSKNLNQFESCNNFTFKYLEVLLTISFLQVLSKTSQPHWYKLDTTEQLNSQLDRTRTLIELVADFAETVLLHHKLLYCLGYIEQLPDELVLQKYCHIFVREIALFNKNILTIHNKDLKDVVFRDTQNVVPKSLKPEPSPTDTDNVYEKQIAVATILLDLEEPRVLHFGICQQRLALLSRNNTYVLIGELPLHCFNFLHQKHNKPHTTLREGFYENIKALMETKFYLDEEMLERVKLTVNNEFEAISQEICSILNKHLHFLEDTVVNSADEQIKLIFKKLLTYFKANNIKLRSYKTAYKLGTKLNILPEVQIFKLHENKETIGLAGELAVFLLSLNSTKHLDEYLSNSLHRLQTCLTRLYLIREFRNYVKLLRDLDLQYIQFPVYSDFRGRIYYNSHASPQSYWYFRFIYHFGWIDRAHLPKTSPTSLSCLPELNVNLQDATSYELEIYLAIGVLFKAECSDKDGKIFLHKLLSKGYSVFSAYSTSYVSDGKLLAKEGVELFYYISILRDLRGAANKLKLKYIFKDTTCSMTQHAGKLLGYKAESLEFLNLNNQTYAYDTYSIYIQHLLRYLQQNPPLGWDSSLERYITRKNFKNLIMTVEYGVTERTAYYEYCQTINQLTTLSKPLQQKLLDYKLFKVFYTFFQEGLVNLTLFYSTRKLWTDYLLTNKILHFELPDLSLHNYYYYKSKNIVFYENTSLPTKNKRERHSVSLPYQIHNNLDHYLLKKKSKNIYSLSKTATAAYVNAIHTLDAYYLRRITHHCALNNVPVITIHDGFGIPFTQTTKLIDLANIAFCESLEPTNQLLAKNKLLWQFSASIVI